MADYSSLADQIAAQQIRERVATAERSRLAGRPRRRSGRHALATRLHQIADRLDV